MCWNNNKRCTNTRLLEIHVAKCVRNFSSPKYWTICLLRSSLLLDAPVLYSQLKVADLLKPGINAKRKAIERHHLFPRKYLERTGVRDQRLINQVANYALVEWGDNDKISDLPPKEYAPKYESTLTNEELEKMYDLHALWKGWYETDYIDFLKERRKRIAAIVERDFKVCKKAFGNMNREYLYKKSGLY